MGEEDVQGVIGEMKAEKGGELGGGKVEDYGEDFGCVLFVLGYGSFFFLEAMEGPLEQGLGEAGGVCCAEGGDIFKNC